MKILITGATGLIGARLENLFKQNQIQIHYLTTSKAKIIKSSNYEGFYWNPNQGYMDVNALKGVDAIIHLAGATIAKRWTKKYKQEIIESRTITTNLLFETLKSNPNQVKQIISASATGLYPDNIDKIYTEDFQNYESSFLSTVVQNWEKSVDQFQLLDLPVCKLRTGIVLSNKGGALPKMMQPIQFGFGAAFGSGNQIQSWIHIEDLSKMYLFALQNKWTGVYNAVSPNPISNIYLTQLIANRLKKPLFLPNIPRIFMQLMLGKMSSLLLESQNVDSKKCINAGFKFEFETIEKAIKNLIP